MTAARRRSRSTIRLRLTALYAGAFLVAGAALIAILYVILGRALDDQLSTRTGLLEHLPGLDDTGPDSTQAAHEAQAALRAQFRRDRDDTLDTMLTASLVALGVVGVVAGGAGWLLAGRALRPLQQITNTARRVADRNLHERIDLDGPQDEIKDLADTFDAMLERLDRAFDGQRRFVANASHELRTPLTINRTLIEVALDDPHTGPPLRQLGGTLLAVNRRHERLIDGLLTLASSEQRLAEPTLVDLADVADHVATEARVAARAAGADIHMDLRPAPVAGDPVLLERLVQNLVDNAVRYNIPEGGTVTVTTAEHDGVAGPVASVTVDNTGPPVPPYEIPGLFEPFHRSPATERRADPSATTNRGAGLGLSIVRSVAQAHGGEVHATARPGGGLSVEVTFPAARPETGA